MMFRKTALCLLASAAVALGASDAFAVSVTESDGVWVIETDSYVVHFKTAAQAGYSQAFAEGGSLLGANQGRTVYHSHNYDGWKDWGAASEVNVLEEGANHLVINYLIQDAGSKVYNLTATYWDGVPYFKHELSIDASAALPSFGSGHEPMCEPRNGKGAENEYALWEEPLHHVAFANSDGYFAMYSEQGTARIFVGWQGDGRMDLVHNDLSQDLAAGESSDPIAFYFAVGSGGLDDANALADRVTEIPTAVEPSGKLASVWGSVKKQ